MRSRVFVSLATPLVAVAIFSRSAVAQTSDYPPTAVPGPHQVVTVGQTVYLDGTESFDDNDSGSLLFSWAFSTQPSGSLAVLAGDDTATPSFVADLPGIYVVDLVVTDTALQDSAIAWVEIASVNLAPTADAGDHQSVYVGTTVFLDGTGSTDPDQDALTFAWTISYQPPGSLAVLSNADTATPSITPDVEGEYVMSLVVNDGFVDSDSPGQVSVMATSGVDVATEEVRKAFVKARSTPKDEYLRSGLKRTTLGTLKDIHRDLLKGNVAIAESGLSRIIQRFDGCALRGSADVSGNPGGFAIDWILNCAFQMPIYDPMDVAIDALNP
jgi:hypothetical protein